MCDFARHLSQESIFSLEADPYLPVKFESFIVWTKVEASKGFGVELLLGDVVYNFYPGPYYR